MSYVYYIRAVAASANVREAVDNWCGTEEDSFYNDYDGFIKLLHQLSLKYPAETITYNIAFEEAEHTHQRVYACNGKTQIVDAVFPACTLDSPVMVIRHVEITIMGHDIPWEITVPENWDQDQVYRAAKEELKRMM